MKNTTSPTRAAAATIVERRSRSGIYDLTAQEMIVDHPKFGRVLIIEGFGGNELQGQAYRWRHGMAVALHADDSFAGIDKIDDRKVLPDTFLGLAMLGDDQSRPILNWSGRQIEKLAQEAGA